MLTDMHGERSRRAPNMTYIGGDTCSHSSSGTTLGGAWTHSSNNRYGLRLFVISMGNRGLGLHREGGWLIL